MFELEFKVLLSTQELNVQQLPKQVNNLLGLRNLYKTSKFGLQKLFYLHEVTKYSTT